MEQPSIQELSSIDDLVLVDPEPARKRLSPIYVEQLEYLSLGYDLETSAHLASTTKQIAQSRRGNAKRRLGVKTVRQAVVEGIQRGLIPIDSDESTTQERLSPRQDAVLRLLAEGWTHYELAEKYSVSVNTINNHYGEIRQKMGARNMNHAMRRAFEVGIFKVGEEILDPDQVEDIRALGLRLSIEGKVLTLSEIGIKFPREIELLSMLGKLGTSHFRREDIYNLGFYPEAVSKTAKSHAYGRAIITITQKLEQASGGPVIEKVHKKDGYVTYGFRKPIGIGSPENLQFLPAYDEERDRTTISKAATPAPRKRKRPKKIVKKAVKSNPPKPKIVSEALSPRSRVIADEYLEPSSLAVLDENFLTGMKAREPEEVLKNPAIKRAISTIVDRGLLADHKSKVLVALRYGIDTNSQRSPIAIYRHGSYVKLQEIMEHVPAYQGLDIEDASQILGIRPDEVLQAEEKFIAQHQNDYPALKNLTPQIETKLRELVTV